MAHNILSLANLFDHICFTAFEIVFLHFVDFHGFFVHPHGNLLQGFYFRDGQPVDSSGPKTVRADVLDIF